MMKDDLIIIRGAGDIATGCIQKLVRAGFSVLALETEQPSAIRRQVALSEAVYEGSCCVEDLTAVCVDSLAEARRVIDQEKVPVMVDPFCKVLENVTPLAVIDAILAKKNLGMSREMAPITVALGPGFSAGIDVDAVIETMRGHGLGRLILKGSAALDTGSPGIIEGVGKERVIHAHRAGSLCNGKRIGDLVTMGEAIETIDGSPVPASLTGVLRGLIRDGFQVVEGFKIADIDPRCTERDNCFTISDKARCIGGAVLEAILMLRNRKKSDS